MTESWVCPLKVETSVVELVLELTGYTVILTVDGVFNFSPTMSVKACAILGNQILAKQLIF